MLTNNPSDPTTAAKVPVSRYLLAAAPALIIGFAFGLGMILRDCSITCNVGYKFTPFAILSVVFLAVLLFWMGTAISLRLYLR